MCMLIVVQTNFNFKPYFVIFVFLISCKQTKLSLTPNGFKNSYCIY